MTSGLTNCATGGDPTIEGYLCPPSAVDPSLSSVTAISDPNTSASITAKPGANAAPSSDSWRVEVAARLERYRTRRKPRIPRYPSLLLPFDAPDDTQKDWSRPSPGASAAATAPASQDWVFQPIGEPVAVTSSSSAEPRQAPDSAPELSAKVIEFPRSAAIPVFHASELADPIFDRPRIVEAPEILPPPPALGGMMIEPAPQESADRRADSPSTFPSASIARRMLASFVDGLVLAASLAAFAAIFLRLNPIRGPLPMLAGSLGGIALLLWAAYEFLFVVYTGSTPGLRAARLQLAGFDGSPLSRRSRRWRVLASFLSAFAAGLGYFWAALDQDGLCWHDRITRTHVQSR
jgi:uncharacterized RDD family membrane protein YckC